MKNVIIHKHVSEEGTIFLPRILKERSSLWAVRTTLLADSLCSLKVVDDSGDEKPLIVAPLVVFF